MLSEMERQELRSGLKEAAAARDARSAVQSARKLMTESSKASDAIFCASALARMTDALRDQLGARELKTYAIRSVTVEPILPYLSVEGALSNYLLELQVGGYGSYADELLNSRSPLAAFQPDLVLIFLDLEEIAGRLPDLCSDGIGAAVEGEIEACVERIAQLLRGFREINSARVLFQGLVLPDRTSLGDVGDANLPHSLPNAILELNRRLAVLCRTVTDCVFFDVDRLGARYGRARWRDARMYLASRLPVSAEYFSAYARGVVRTFSPMFRAPRKVLCTDLDNTLWGGILGEDGADGIATGSAFPGNCYLEYQRYLKQLSSRGILLAIVSKNNEMDVREAFQARSADLGLSLDDFVARKIGWNDKEESLRELAQELSLGLDSFVFVDDSEVECAAVERQLPEVAVLRAPKDEPWKLIELLSAQPYFDTASVTGDDLNRLSEYKAQAQRAELAGSAGSRDEFLASLGIVCTFQSALLAPLARAVQLMAKTNQFNLTTRRRSAAEIDEIASSPGGLAVAVRVRDHFGDAGVVGLALVRQEGEECIVDSLLLSCRVIGRGIETALLAYVLDHARQWGARRLVGEYIPTAKNAPCAKFYPDHGFSERLSAEAGKTGSVLYELDLSAPAPKSPKWIQLEGLEPNELSRSAVVSA